MFMKKMGLDYGDARIGIATSDALGMIASGLETYVRKSPDKDIEYITSLVKKHNIDTVVMGLPLNMDGTIGKRAELTKQFASKLQKHIDAKIVYQDERLTSVEAEEILIKQKMPWQERKKVIDQLAAAIILQTYLDKQS